MHIFMATTTYYAVACGHTPGIYEDWSLASEHVTGYPGAVYKSFRTREEAETYLQAKTPTDDHRLPIERKAEA